VPDIAMIEVPSKLVELLATPNVGTRQSVWEQYDHTILTNTVFGPGASDAAVLRQKGTPTGLAISMDCNSRYCYLDPFEGARHAVAEAARNVACSGARPLGITNCLNFGSPERSPANWQLTRAVEGLGDACRSLGIPIVSGNVSLYNETEQQPVYPTPMVGCVGVLDDLSTRMALSWSDGDDIWVLGGGEPSLGGSEYLASIHNLVAGAPPALDIDAEQRLLQLLQVLAASGHPIAAHDVSGGGLAIALTEMALASGIGATVTAAMDARRVDVTWFGESAGRVVVAMAPEWADQLKMVAAEWDTPVTYLGASGGDSLELSGAQPMPLTALADASRRALLVGVEAEMA
jgi:phosphoribosylformylglycinamidine synthase subunit PurL